MLEMNSACRHVLNRLCEEVREIMKLKKENEIEWETNVKILFLLAMIGHKPVGVNRHFMMMLIHNKFSSQIDHQISSQLLWDHLDSLYDMAALHESEIIPFPNEETDFELPEDCYDIVKNKYGITLKLSSSENESGKNSDPRKKLSTPKIKQTNASVTPKTNFATPVLNKSVKNQIVAKSEIKTPTNEVTPKNRQDLGSSGKSGKVKRSSSPLSSRPAPRPDNTPVAKVESTDTKKVRSERSNSPAVIKKPVKSETSGSSSTSKKVKSESASNVARSVKEQTPDSIKKAKGDKDLTGKRSKSSSESSTTNVSTKSVKAENVNGTKKKDSESSHRKSESSVKQAKQEAKNSQSSKKQDAEANSGSRKSSPVVKVKSSDSSKKLKRQRSDDVSKKSTPVQKRRRIV